MAWWPASEQHGGKLIAPTVPASPQAASLAFSDDEAEAEIAPEVATFRLPANPPTKPSGSGSAFSPPVAVKDAPSDLPPIDGIQWEAKADGSFECWYAPQGVKASRKTKRYLARVGKRLQVSWQKLPPDDREQVIRQWVADRLAGKSVK